MWQAGVCDAARRRARLRKSTLTSILRGRGTGADESKTGVDAPKLYRNYVNGEFLPASDGTTIEVINPATNQVTGLIPRSKAADVEAGESVGGRGLRVWWWCRWHGRKCAFAHTCAVHARAERPGLVCVTQAAPHFTRAARSRSLLHTPAVAAAKAAFAGEWRKTSYVERAAMLDKIADAIEARGPGGGRTTQHTPHTSRLPSFHFCDCCWLCCCCRRGPRSWCCLRARTVERPCPWPAKWTSRVVRAWSPTLGGAHN